MTTALRKLGQGARHFHRATAAHATPVILSATRTPIGAFQGALKSMTGPELGAVAIKSAVEKAGIEGADVNEAFLGNVVSAGVGQAPARQAVIKAGLPESVNCTTVNKVCSSGMKPLMLGAQSIQAEYNKVVLAGGFESMSNIPYYLPKGRGGYGYGHGQGEDGVIRDGLWDVYNDIHMGSCAENTAEKNGLHKGAAGCVRDRVLPARGGGAGGGPVRRGDHPRQHSPEEGGPQGFLCRRGATQDEPRQGARPPPTLQEGRHGHRCQRLLPQRWCRGIHPG